MISSVDLYAQEAAKGIPGQIFLVTDESQGGDGIVARPEIASVAELRGKKVAYAHGGPSDYLLFKALDGAGVALDEVDLVAVDDPSRAGEAFISGDVDAAVTWEPFLSQAAQDPERGHVLATTADYPEVIVDVLVASAELAGNEALLLEFIDGWIRSVEFIQENPDQAATYMALGLNVPKEDVSGMMAGLRYADRRRNSHFFNSIATEDTRLAMLLDEAGAYWQSIGVLGDPEDGSSRVWSGSCKHFNPN
jgi:NitT/TauT family transport system substrate-binding protein